MEKVNIILQLDKTSYYRIFQKGRIKIGWNICRAEEYFNIIRCFNCHGYGHFARDCKNQAICPKCRVTHDKNNCKSPTLNCINCINANKKYNLKLETGHVIYDKNCHCFNSTI